MIKVDKWHLELDNSEDLLSTELALLLYTMRTERPEKLFAAMEASDRLYKILKEGK